jgi:hypothetical protein
MLAASVSMPAQAVIAGRDAFCQPALDVFG